MENLSNEIREAVKKLLEEEKVDLVIGFSKGSLPLRAAPCFVRNADDADKLVWNSTCENNLAVYLPKRKERIAIVAKGCDSRSIIGHIKEGQVDRDKLVIIGVPCTGMIDRIKVSEKIGGRDILEVEEKENELVVKGDGFEETLSKKDYLPDNCRACTHRNPVVHDIMIGPEVEEQTDTDEFQTVKAFEESSPDERWEYFKGLADKCIRCYACRNACPLCYCDECAVDCSQPQWFGKSVGLADTQVFHIMRALHTAGRCVDCGACVRACPMDVDLRFFNKKIDKDVRELFSYEAGVNPDDSPPLNTFNTEDYDEFIKG